MDYFAVLSRTLTFAAGSAQGSSQCTNIDIVNDNFLEADIETFFADLTTDPNIAQVDPARSQATITIQDDDMSKRLSENVYTVQTYSQAHCHFSQLYLTYKIQATFSQRLMQCSPSV